MNSFLRRLKYYGVGFGIGLLFVFFFFKNRGCTWLPGNRVKNTVLERVLVASAEDQAYFDRMHWSDSMIVSFLNDGDIEFGSSKKQGDPQVYVVSKKIEGKAHTLWFTLPKDAFISEVLVPKENVQRVGNSVRGMARMIHFPNVDNLVYLADNDLFEKDFKQLGIKNSKQVFRLLKKSGYVDFSNSNLSAKPLPEQKIGFVLKGDTLTATTTWYKDHIQFFEFDK